VTTNGGRTWTCGVANVTGTAIDTKYLPGACR